MEFDWNPAKCSKNIAERGIDFADVLVGFIDPARKVVRDDRKDYGEVRYNMLAKVEGRRLTFTVSASDDRGLVAVGKVVRVIVDKDRFMNKCGT